MIALKTEIRNREEREWVEKNPEYEHRIVGIREFIESPEYLNLGNDLWDSVTSELKVFYSRKYQEAALCWAIGAGKSYFSSIVIVYEIYKLLCLNDPQQFYELARNTKIAFMNMSTSASQAHKVVFSEIKDKIDNSPWFQRLYIPNPSVKSEIVFDKNVYIISGSSSVKAPLGYAIFGAVMDEAAFYTEEGAVTDWAQEMYYALQRRIRSRFGNAGVLIMISSPRYFDDFIEIKLAEAKVMPEIYSSRRALYEMMPQSRYSGVKFWFNLDNCKIYKKKAQIPKTEEVVEIPIEYLNDFTRNPEKAKRDLMAVPSIVIEPFFKDFQAIRSSENKKLTNAWADGKIPDKCSAPDSRARYIHIDLGLTKDALGFAMGHREGHKVVFDAIFRLKAQPGGEINFATARDIVYGYRNRGYDIFIVTYDGFESVDSRQILRGKGIKTDYLSVDRDLKAYDTMKDLAYTGCLEYPEYIERVNGVLTRVAVRELRRLELVKGKKVDHTPKGSKDVADAMAGVCLSIVTHEVGFTLPYNPYA